MQPSEEFQEIADSPVRDPPLPQFTAWEYGVALKQGRRLFLLWESTVESYLIDGCDYIDQLHFHEDQDSLTASEDVAGALSLPPAAVVVLSHGFSDIVGPAYALIQCLAGFLRANGHRVVVPDYRPRYVVLPSLRYIDLRL
jgi:hypothetical protein